MKLETLRDLYLDCLQDLHSAETQLAKALGQMAGVVSHQQLRQAFEIHIEETRQHALRLEQLLARAGQSPGAQFCEGMEGLLKEAFELIDRHPDPDVLDAGLIAATQKAEHYEIAGYGAARTYAEILGDNYAAQLLQETLNEARQTDEKLNQIAATRINLEAAQARQG